MKYLLNVNVLLALLLAAHEHHEIAETWIEALDDRDEVLLSAWTEMGFVRVVLQVPSWFEEGWSTFAL